MPAGCLQRFGHGPGCGGLRCAAAGTFSDLHARCRRASGGDVACNAASIERSLARYGYETIFSRGDLSEGEQTEARARINELLRYLEM